jgi:hypothetical protein
VCAQQIYTNTTASSSHSETCVYGSFTWHYFGVHFFVIMYTASDNFVPWWDIRILRWNWLKIKKLGAHASRNMTVQCIPYTKCSKWTENGEVVSGFLAIHLHVLSLQVFSRVRWNLLLTAGWREYTKIFGLVPYGWVVGVCQFIVALTSR